MKKVIYSAFVASAIMLSSALTTVEVKAQNAQAKAKTQQTVKADKTLKVVPASSKVTWTGKKVTGEHSGNISVSNGTLLLAKNNLVGGNIEMDMNSLTVTDLKDAEYNGKLVGHLKADDFFGVEKHPKANLKVTSVSPIKGAKQGTPNYTVNGDLTIKGITKPVTFPATVKVEGNKANATGTITVDRTKYDIKYGSKSFFESIGDKAINDDFTLDFNVVAQQ